MSAYSGAPISDGEFADRLDSIMLRMKRLLKVPCKPTPKQLTKIDAEMGDLIAQLEALDASLGPE